ncbi:MAG: GDSL-type esterase/lipase family protein [Victivallales bacterium]
MKVICRVGLVLGILAVLSSSTPLHYLSALMFAAIFFFLILAHLENNTVKKILTGLKILITLLCLVAVLLEGGNWIVPQLSHGSFDKFYVVGDSISAGIGFQGEKVWPEVMSKEHGIKAVNLSVGGATLSSALSSADGIKDEKAVVILEIGGNDILRRTSLKKFEENLEKLLKKLCLPGRTVIMFELPLPPFNSSFCVSQRRICRKYGVYLIPRRVFADILTGEMKSADGLHLSNYGHAHMAETVWGIVKNAFMQKD